MKPDSRANQENEVALTISSYRPDKVVERIAGLSSVASFELVPLDSLRIRDLYFDTPDRAFEPQWLALRLRATGPEWLIALKGPSRPTNWGGVERLEIEEPWSRDALARVLSELAVRGIQISQPPSIAPEAHPRDVLERAGFKVIQDRETHRQIRSVHLEGESDGPVPAELAIDSVLYRAGSKEIRHHEVEIEAKTEVGVSVIPPVIDALTTMFGDELMVWEHSKLAIGFALEELLKRGDLEGLLDRDGNLMPAAYDKIDDYLTNGDS